MLYNKINLLMKPQKFKKKTDLSSSDRIDWLVQRIKATNPRFSWYPRQTAQTEVKDVAVHL